MKEIRICCADSLTLGQKSRYACEWMHASLANRWLLKMRLSAARLAHGDDSHWVEMREKHEALGKPLKSSGAPPAQAEVVASTQALATGEKLDCLDRISGHDEALRSVRGHD